MHDPIWRCADGRRMRIGEMATSHVQNCIRMIERGHDGLGRRVGRKTRALLPRLKLEIDIRNIRNYDNKLWG
jgi:hypothetical protein